jgi:hypothetical protein
MSSPYGYDISRTTPTRGGCLALPLFTQRYGTLPRSTRFMPKVPWVFRVLLLAEVVKVPFEDGMDSFRPRRTNSGRTAVHSPKQVRTYRTAPTGTLRGAPDTGAWPCGQHTPASCGFPAGKEVPILIMRRILIQRVPSSWYINF